jgi:transcriptional regulator with XRE-family HTH domain
MPFRGERLKIAREEKGLTQQQLADLAGLDKTQISRYEHEKHDPSTRILETLADLVGVSTDYLLGRSDDPVKRYGDGELNDEQLTILETFGQDRWYGLLRLVAERMERPRE